MLGINHCLKKTVTYSVVFLLISLIFIPCLNGELSEKYNENFYLTDEEIKEIINSSVLDLKYVYNITRDLSYIIFTEYDEENGELAKGRFFGTKGERKAAEILYDNMTELGLWTTLEKIENTPNLPELTHKYEILDYGLKINNRTIEKHEFHIVPSKIGPRNNSELKDYNFSFEGLKVIPMPDFPILWTLRNKNSIEEDFVFIRVDAAFNPDARSFINKIKVRFINPMKLIGIPTIINHAKRDFRLTRVYNNIPQWKGTIGYDLIDNTYNMGASFHIFPLIYINKTLATEILNNLDGAIVDYYINQRYNTSVESYNVIGQLNGTDPSKTVIVDCLYDSWWCQGTGDAAIGMATVLGIAKYFTENNITPKYNIKFIGFCGEESGLRGAWHYEDTHKDEDIPYVIDLNQIGFYQIEPRLNLNIMANKLTFLNEVWKIAKKTDYKKIVDNTAGIIPVLDITGAPSDDQIFAMNRPLKCRTVCFIKSYDWVLHHRDGEKHTEGDVLKYFDWADVSATGEIALNITIYLTVEK